MEEHVLRLLARNKLLKITIGIIVPQFQNSRFEGPDKICEPLPANIRACGIHVIENRADGIIQVRGHIQHVIRDCPAENQLPDRRGKHAKLFWLELCVLLSLKGQFIQQIAADGKVMDLVFHYVVRLLIDFPPRSGRFNKQLDLPRLKNGPVCAEVKTFTFRYEQRVHWKAFLESDCYAVCSMAYLRDCHALSVWHPF